jgi:predicted nucleic acid-binding protein
MLPPEICLDANIFVAAMLPSEPHHEQAQSLLALLEDQDIPLFEPALVLFEVSSAIHRRRLLGELTDKEADKTADLFFQLPLLLQWQSFLIKQAVQIAVKLSCKRMYDFAYLSLAINRDIPLITLDEDLEKRGGKIYKKIHNPEDFLTSIELSQSSE